MFNYVLLSIVFSIAFFELIAQSSVKYFHKTEKTQYLYYFIAILSYCVIAYLLTLSYDHKGMGITNLLWSGITIIIILMAGMILYDEKLTNYDIMGLCLILSGTGFILYEENF
jgi:multidrug transporter EmrE-like cation transporter